MLRMPCNGREAEGGNGHWYQVITVESGFPMLEQPMKRTCDLAESVGGSCGHNYL